jgi:hypothetical protein
MGFLALPQRPKEDLKSADGQKNQENQIWKAGDANCGSGEERPSVEEQSRGSGFGQTNSLRPHAKKRFTSPSSEHTSSHRKTRPLLMTFFFFFLFFRIDSGHGWLRIDIHDEKGVRPQRPS